MYRAYGLEKALGTKSKIYYKYEGVSPAGSHKPNKLFRRLYYNMKEGVKKISTETGAGQWGSALSFACKLFGIECEIFMVKVSYEGKPYRKIMMNTWGGTVHALAEQFNECRKKYTGEISDSPGSLGIAISEAVERAATNSDTKYSLGSVLNHVLDASNSNRTGSIETNGKSRRLSWILLLPRLDGGSNFAGITFPFLENNLTGGKR